MITQILCLGYLKKPRGLAGQVKVRSYGELLNDYSEGDSVGYYSAKRVIDGLLDQPHHENNILIESVTPCKDGYLLKPKGSNKREDVECYCGLFLGVPFEEAKSKFGGSSEPYLFEYLNLKIIDYKSKQSIGHVLRLEEIKEKVILIVRLYSSSGEVMLPIASDYVVKINIKKGVLYSKRLHELVQS